MPHKIKVLIVDDSAFVRTMLQEGLSKDPEITVIDTAADPYQARDKIVILKPDVLTLDVEMPRMDGVEFLRKLMPQYPLPVIMVSALTTRSASITLDALAAGAVDFVTKPSSYSLNVTEMIDELSAKIKMAAKIDVSGWKKNKEELTSIFKKKKQVLIGSTDKVIAIGASTGGTEALRKIISEMPVSSPGIVIVQHMPPGFTRMFAERLNGISRLEVKEAQSGDRIRPGRALIAPGGQHMTVIRSGGMYMVNCSSGENVCGHCPSVEVMLKSVAHEVGSNALGVVLTGMGKDGAGGLLELHKTGAKTIVQDEKTSVVFGMPKAAWELGAADFMLPLQEIPDKIVDILSKR